MVFKNLLRKTAQRLLGFESYLFVFARLGGWRMRMGGYEKELLFFISILPEKGIILDIGANIGITTVAFAQRKKQSSVYAFEPVPANLGVLHRIIAHYRLDNVRVLNIALGDHNGYINMIMPEIDHVKMQGLSHVLEENGNSREKGDIFSVPVQRLDDIQELMAADQIIAIKLDVENYEYFVLQGALKCIEKHRPFIYCELWGNARRLQCIELMREHGYEVKVFEKGKLVDHTTQKAINFFFLPANKPIHV